MELADEGLEMLTEEECWRLVGTAEVGRVAFSMGEVPVVFPVTFAVIGGNVVFFTGTGTKFDAAQEGRAASFEVDEIDPLAEQGWSVLVVGRASPASRATKGAAETHGLYPWADGDRQHLVEITPTFLSGRRVFHEAPVSEPR